MAFRTEITVTDSKLGYHRATIISFGPTHEESRHNAAYKTKRCGYLDRNSNYHIVTVKDTS